ncbi:putative Pentatricopeptide repeat-containing protein [Quillaja saponaria]|uniref:Pentatricopeptide repeat-containing protein n=1 Tax=Quillaja saponaria TaxID=32244 RepID=A0AAD7Q425_QUISA|nr:putative Pentatricopeptide repeat-containing protein [Quillaja saponaria]
MQISVPVRTPAWVSRRRILEEKLSELHKCTNSNQVKQVHAQILKANLHQDLYVTPKLIAALSLCRQMVLAVNVFKQVHEPNVHLYNTLIRAHIQNSQPLQAFATFFEMQKSGVYPDNFTYPFLLKGCAGRSRFPVIQMIHSHIVKIGFYSDIFVPNSLIDTYSRCGLLGVIAARKLFMAMIERDTVSWNSMIGGLVRADGYVKAGEMNEAFKFFEKMPERNVVSWSTMVTGYSKAGDMVMARMLFDKMPVKNLVIWTIIISGYAEKGLAKEATALYDQMEESGLKPDVGAVVSILAACAESGLLGLGKKVHASIERTRFKCITLVSNALIDMYAKCGCLDTAFRVFNGVAEKDVVSWNVILQGLAVHGHGKKALQLFSRMIHEGFEPDKVTFVGVLCACTHAGLVEEGRKYFYSMERDHGIVPQIEHYGCMIDLLGRGGHLTEAFRLLHSMPVEPNAIIWGTLLGACRMHNAVELAKELRDHLFKLEPSDPGNFTLLSNIYAQAGDWGTVADVRLRMKDAGVQKPSGASSIELEEEVHEFTVLDASHPKSDDIYQMIGRLVQDLRQVGYVPNVYE